MARQLVLLVESFRVLAVTGIAVDWGGLASTDKQQLQAGPFESPLAGCEGIDCVERYVAQQDAEFTWYDTQHRLSGRDKNSGENWTGYVLNVTSQRWTRTKTSSALWWHVLVVVVPANLQVRHWATLHIDFGKNTMHGLRHFSNRDPSGRLGTVEISNDTLEARLPDITDAVWSSVQMAVATRAVAASLFLALNQYQTFPEDLWHRRRTGDDIKAFTWYNFLFTGATEPERVVELPIAKAVARGMDALSAFTATLSSGQVTEFGVYGHSKFGSATFVAGAIDPRVKAIAPTAFIMGKDSMVAHGGNPSLLREKENPYAALMYWNGTKQLERLMKIVCPLNWMDRLRVPTLMIMDTNDMWMDTAIRDVREWWHDLPEPKSLLFAEAVHDTVTILTMPAAMSFFQGVILQAAVPSIDYTFDVHSGNLTVTQRSTHSPTSLHLHFARSCYGAYPEPRFLRSKWASQSVWMAPGDVANGTTRQWTFDLYDARLAMTMMGDGSLPSGECSRGAFMEVRYQWPQAGWPFQLSTPVFLVPLAGSHSKP